MYLAYCPDQAVARALTEAMPRESGLWVASTWQTFLHGILKARVLIIQVPDQSISEFTPRLRRLQRNYPMRPVILITSRHPETLRRLLLRNFTIADLVWTEALPQGVSRALRRALVRGLLGRIAALIEASDISPASLRNALAFAVRAPRPPRRVADLAKLANCDRTTLWRQWQAAFGAKVSATPTHFVGWILLVHGVSRKRVGNTWAAVADELGIHEHTLARLGKRYVGLGLKECADNQYEAFARRFKSEVLRPLLKKRCAR